MCRCRTTALASRLGAIKAKGHGTREVYNGRK